MCKKQRTLCDTPFSQDKFDMLGAIKTDPQGSYTGRPDDPGETPVQDADDL